MPNEDDRTYFCPDEYRTPEGKPRRHYWMPSVTEMRGTEAMCVWCRTMAPTGRRLAGA